MHSHLPGPRCTKTTFRPVTNSRASWRRRGQAWRRTGGSACGGPFCRARGGLRVLLSVRADHADGSFRSFPFVLGVAFAARRRRLVRSAGTGSLRGVVPTSPPQSWWPQDGSGGATRRRRWRPPCRTADAKRLSPSRRLGAERRPDPGLSRLARSACLRLEQQLLGVRRLPAQEKGGGRLGVETSRIRGIRPTGGDLVGQSRAPGCCSPRASSGRRARRPCGR